MLDGQGEEVLSGSIEEITGAAGEAAPLPHGCDTLPASPWVGGGSPFGFPVFFGISLLFFHLSSVFYFGELKIR